MVLSNCARNRDQPGAFLCRRQAAPPTLYSRGDPRIEPQESPMIMSVHRRCGNPKGAIAKRAPLRLLHPTTELHKKAARDNTDPTLLAKTNPLRASAAFPAAEALNLALPL